MGQSEGSPVGCVVAEHIKDESLLDGLLHGVHVEGCRVPVWSGTTEHFQGLPLRGCGERVEGNIRGNGARSHLSGEHILDANFAAIFQCFNLRLGEYRAQLLRAGTSLGRVSLICDNRKPLVCKATLFGERIQYERESLKRHNNDELAACELMNQQL